MNNKKFVTGFKKFTVAVPPALGHRLTAEARRDSSSVATVVRRLIHAGLRTEDRQRRLARD